LYLLPTKENKLPFPVPFAANERKFDVSVICCPLDPFSVGGIPETWRHDHEDMWTWRHEDMEMENGDMETRGNRHGDMET
jgi:hypothetical protein